MFYLPVAFLVYRSPLCLVLQVLAASLVPEQKDRKKVKTTGVTRIDPRFQRNATCNTSQPQPGQLGLCACVCTRVYRVGWLPATKKKNKKKRECFDGG